MNGMRGLASFVFAIACGVGLAGGPPRDQADRLSLARVRKLLIEAEQRPEPGMRGLGVIPIEQRDADALLRLLPEIEVPWVLDQAAQLLRIWKVRESIPILVRSLSIPSLHDAAGSVLGSWGWDACDALIRGARAGSFHSRVKCVEILAGQARDRPEDVRLHDVFLSFAKAEPIEFRRAAVRGLANLAFRVERWMEMSHPGTMDDPLAFEALLKLVCDPDPDVRSTAIYCVRDWLSSREGGIQPGLMLQPFVIAKSELSNLAQIARQDRSPFCRAAALALFRAGNGPIDDLVEAVSDTDPMVERIAIWSLSGRLTSSMLPRLRQIAAFGVPSARRAAAYLVSSSPFGLTDKPLR